MVKLGQVGQSWSLMMFDLALHVILCHTNRVKMPSSFLISHCVLALFVLIC